MGRGTDGQVGKKARRGPPEQAEASPVSPGLWGRLRAKPGKGADVRGTCFTSKLSPKWQECLSFRRASGESIYSSG